MAKRKFYILTSAGQSFEISELDFNNLSGRLERGGTKGWYAQRQAVVDGEKHDWKIQLQYVASVYADTPESVTERDEDTVDLDKRKRPAVGKPEAKKDTKCTKHNWNDATTYEFVTTDAGGVSRYYKQCPECLVKSTLIKKREVEIAMEADGKTIEDVKPLVTAEG